MGSSDSQSVYLVFEGGGAKGIVHVGALEAIQAAGSDPDLPRLKIEAVAGTSIGAVVAAFVAAGADARKDLIDEHGSLPLITARPGSPTPGELPISHLTDLFRPSGWRRMSIVRFAMLSGGRMAVLFLLAIPFLAAVSHFFLEFYVERPTQFATYVSLTIAIVVLARGFLSCLAWLRSSDGYQWAPQVSWLIAAILLATLHGVYGTGLTAWFPLRTHGQYVAIGLMLLLLYLSFLFIRRLFKGVVSTELMRTHLNQALARILSTNGSQAALHKGDGSARFDEVKFSRLLREGVRFSDLHLPLRVVAADVINNRINLWPNESEPNPKVADVLVASIAVPFLFKPRWSSNGAFVDGGIVSNIPAWAFRPHRTVNPDAYIIALGIEPSLPDRAVPAYLDARAKAVDAASSAIGKFATKAHLSIKHIGVSFTYPFILFKNTLYTTLFGARSLEVDATDRLEVIPLSVAIQTRFGVRETNLLDFDMKRHTRLALVDQSRSSARARLVRIFKRRQEIFDDLARKIEDELYLRAEDNGHSRHVLMRSGGAHLVTNHNTGQPQPTAGRIRVFLAIYHPVAETLKTIRTYNFADDVDDRIYLPENTTLAGLSHRHGEPYFASRQHLTFAFSGDANRYRRAVKWPQLQWCWTIPFEASFKDNPSEVAVAKRYVLGVESNIPIDCFGRIWASEGMRESARWMDYVANGDKPKDLGDRDAVTLRLFAADWQRRASRALSEPDSN